MRRTILNKNTDLLRSTPSTGALELRQAIAAWLLAFRGMSVSPSQIILGAGTESLYSLLIKLLGRDKCYAVEEPGYGKIAKIYDAGMRFCYFDGSEGVDPPCGVNVSRAQLRVVSRFATPPLFTEGAAKSHFGWHLQAGANAFDVFPPEIFKKMIVRFPQDEAPIMRKDFTRLDFGWWSLCLPGQNVKLKDRLPYEKCKSIGTQPDMWEFGTSRAAAWNCPATVMLSPNHAEKHPRIADLLEVMRRWEDVRAGKLLDKKPEWREALKSPTQEHHLYLNGDGEYELHEIEMLPTPEKAPHVRGFVFERCGNRVVACWHTCGKATLDVALDKPESLPLAGLRYIETSLVADAVKTVWTKAVER